MGVIALIALVWAVVLEVRLRRLMRGGSGQSLEGVIRQIGTQLEGLTHQQNLTDTHLKDLEQRVKRSLQGASTVRFNSPGTGGNQSFSLALTDEHGNGVIISSLHARERIGIFAKPIESYASIIGLTPEEKQALNDNRQRLNV